MREGKRTEIKPSTVVGHGRGHACNVDMYAVFPIWRPWPEWLTGEPRFGAYSAEDGRTLRGHARRGGRLGRDGPEGESEWLREMEGGRTRAALDACVQSVVSQADRQTNKAAGQRNERNSEQAYGLEGPSGEIHQLTAVVECFHIVIPP